MQNLVRGQGLRLSAQVVALVRVVMTAGSVTARAEPPLLTSVPLCGFNPTTLHLPGARQNLPAEYRNRDMQALARTRIATPLMEGKTNEGQCVVAKRAGQFAWLIGLDDQTEVVWFAASDTAERRWRGTAGETTLEIIWPVSKPHTVPSSAEIVACNRDGCTRVQAVPILELTNTF